ncbi:unnamed protein product [Paramecium pentaurelia]|uniref:non-specific serine/threonine protein kinase n=1 Tax=Paramecium pentaurelia TaxID=43138 RepID=A0A8S1SYK6_9CILI|nr:unnamed protein product [Paramecium pentaurelia]
MGNCTLKSTESEDQTVIAISNFTQKSVIGKGGFGKVWMVENKKSKSLYAMKIMSKAKIIAKKSVQSVMNELQLLSQLKHNFIINMQAAFQDRDNLYLVMDLLTGGDLRYHLCKQRKFTEEQTKFFVVCIIVSLEYLHVNGILHRDVKPENLVFDDKGYLKLTDMGIARQWKPENAQDTSGTPGYMAPEVMCRQNHGVGVDYYALGVIVYECIMGKRPYVGKSRQEIRDQVIAKQVQIKNTDIPTGWSLEAVDFANKLIQRKPANRLGVNGPDEVKAHSWFKDYSWDKLLDRQLTAPYIPKEDEMIQIANENRRDSANEIDPESILSLRRNSVQGIHIY